MNSDTQGHLVSLLDEYRSRGHIKAGELLLTPDDALELAQRASAYGIIVTGGDGWRYTPDGKHLVEMVGVYFGIGWDDWNSLRHDELIAKGLELMQEFLMSELSHEAIFIALGFDPNISMREE